MISNIELLSNLRKLKACGINYVDTIKIIQPKIYNYELPNNLVNINKQILACNLCEFSKTRNKIAIDKTKTANIVFIDYRANIVENDTGIVFSGKAGEMIDKMISNVLKVDKKDIFLTNLIKCYSSNNKADNEVEVCKEYTIKQIEILKPKVIIIFSYESYKVLNPDEPSTFNEIKGKIFDFFGAKTIVTNSPKTLLRNPSLKKETLSHLQNIIQYI